MKTAKLLIKFEIINNSIVFKTIEFDFEKSSIKAMIEPNRITIGDSLQGFTIIQYSTKLIQITTDEFNSYPLYYIELDNKLYVFNDLSYLSIIKTHFNETIQLKPAENEVEYFLNNGYFSDCLGLECIHVLKINSETFFSINNLDKLAKKIESKIFYTEIHNDFNVLYSKLVESVDHIIKNNRIEYVDLTGGVDTRAILGAILELGIQDKISFRTSYSDSRDRLHDVEIAKLICKNLDLKTFTEHEYQTNPDLIKNTISGKYGSEFFSGEFRSIWSSCLDSDRLVQNEKLPYLDYHNSTLCDLYYIYMTNTFRYPIWNKYNLSRSPYHMRNMLKILSGIESNKLCNYAFYKYLFKQKLHKLARYPFFSNFASYSNEYQFIKKDKSRLDENIELVNVEFENQKINSFIQDKINSSTITKFEKKRYLARAKIITKYLDDLC